MENLIDMKNIYSLVVALASMASATAQITVTDINIPNIGDESTYHTGQAPVIDISQTGANHIWDYSGLTGGTTSATIDSTTAGQYLDSFPSANQLILSNNGESYYSKDATGLSYHGFYGQGFAHVDFTDKSELLITPITYNDVFNETFGGTVHNFFTNIISERNGTIEIKADGYGDLILPYGTVPNVLRILRVSLSDDYVNGVLTESFVDSTVTFYDQFTNNLIAAYATHYLADGTNTVNTFRYLAEGQLLNVEPVTVSDLPDFSVFPNPASQSVTLQFNQSVKAISITDINGRLVSTIDVSKHVKTIDLTDFSKGLYFVNYRTETEAYSKKLIVN